MFVVGRSNPSCLKSSRNFGNDVTRCGAVLRMKEELLKAKATVTSPGVKVQDLDQWRFLRIQKSPTVGQARNAHSNLCELRARSGRCLDSGGLHQDGHPNEECQLDGVLRVLILLSAPCQSLPFYFVSSSFFFYSTTISYARCSSSFLLLFIVHDHLVL